MLIPLWNSLVRPLMMRPLRFQVAALCYRLGEGGGMGEEARDGTAGAAAVGPEVLLITSRETRRWVLPKGWPKRGHDAGGTALEEAWEEAGIKAEGPPCSVGFYDYDKRLDGGLPMPTRVEVFAIPVSRLLDDYPEKGQRERIWVPAAQAATLVDEPQLSTLLAGFPRHPLIAAPAARGRPR